MKIFPSCLSREEQKDLGAARAVNYLISEQGRRKKHLNGFSILLPEDQNYGRFTFRNFEVQEIQHLNKIGQIVLDELYEKGRLHTHTPVPSTPPSPDFPTSAYPTAPLRFAKAYQHSKRCRRGVRFHHCWWGTGGISFGKALVGRLKQSGAAVGGGDAKSV